MRNVKVGVEECVAGRVTPLLIPSLLLAPCSPRHSRSRAQNAQRAAKSAICAKANARNAQEKASNDEYNTMCAAAAADQTLCAIYRRPLRNHPLWPVKAGPRRDKQVVNRSLENHNSCTQLGDDSDYRLAGRTIFNSRSRYPPASAIESGLKRKRVAPGKA